MNGPIESYWQLLEPKCETINIYEGPDKYAGSATKTTRLVLLLYATHMCSSEVHNGGFLQLFWNSTGIAVPEAIEGYALMGMPELSALVSRAAGTLGNPYPRDRDDRWDALLDASGHSSQGLDRIVRKDHIYPCFVE